MSERGRDGRLTSGLLVAASASYAANAAFGIAVATGAIDNRRIRWVHHALFVTTASLTGLALAAAALQRRRAGVALLPAAAPLTALPYVRGGGVRGHAAIAGLAAPAYAAALVLDRRSR